MSLLQAAILGCIQGVTEFLPISSSAHLVLTSYVLGWEDQGLAFDIVAHLGTLLSLFVFFRQDLRQLVHGFFRPAPKDGENRQRAELGWILLAATLPVAAAGWLFEEQIATSARWPALIAGTSIAFGVLLWWADLRLPHRHDLIDLGWRTGVLIGLAQVLALVPGVSRSGITLTAALALGFGRESSARFSFLLAVPLGVVVAVKQLTNLGGTPFSGNGYFLLLVGFAVSAISSYLTIGWLLSWVRRKSLTPFAVYRIVLGIVILTLVATGARSG
ncbi:MAG: undecaprenyl-diphosphate phosphatase [Acidobacteriota bacterium]|nr:undecaprenyl-diphosphate phosphatase [Acidobacteriota bacterium]